MSQALRLNTSSTVIADTLYFERRRHPRRKASDQVTAVIREPGSDESPAKMLTLDLIDISDSGLGLSAQEPVVVGSRITVFFAPHGTEPGFDLVGEVVRCKPNDDLHVVGVALDESSTKQAG